MKLGGIEAGGTKMVCAIGDEQGNIFDRVVFPTESPQTTVPKMIEYYLHETPILHNAPTYLPYYDDDYTYVMEHFDDLVIKDVSEAGGYGVFFGNTLSPTEKAAFLDKLGHERRRFIAQEVIDFKDLEIMDHGEKVERKADLRVFVLSGQKTQVWKSGLTRFSRNPDSFIVNSSQGGGFKDTWILSQ